MARTRRLPAAVALAAIALASCGSDTPTGSAPGPTAPGPSTAASTAPSSIAPNSIASQPTTAPTDAPADPATPAVIDPNDGGDYRVDVDPARFTSVVDNPFLPLVPGSRRDYRTESSNGEVEIIVVEVLDEHRTVMGVDTIVVRDTVTAEDGELIEDTFDWYAQDLDGNVWYFGESSTAYDGATTSNAGSWEAGVGGALPGIVMPAEPAVSATGYRQEFLAGEAEDMGQVIAVDESIEAVGGPYTDTVRTRDWTPLEPDVVEEKVYAAGVGFVYETKHSGDGTTETVVLTAVSP